MQHRKAIKIKPKVSVAYMLILVLVQKSFDRDIETYIDCSMADYDAILNNLCMNLTSFWADFTCE